jgi:8-oxo-dGTP pyrophosphatase MutT (NUDIX family)
MQETDTERMNGSGPRARTAIAERGRAWITARLDRTAQALTPAAEPFRPSAVLIPIVEREAMSVLFTRRTDHLASHAGQICFPGGSLHAADESLTVAALRELEEEVGIPRDDVDVAGFLNPYHTSHSGFTILPVVGFVRPGFTLRVNDQEVAEVFEAPLDYLIDPMNQRLTMMERGGVMREFHAIDVGPHTVWGATAAMIVDLAERLRDA